MLRIRRSKQRDQAAPGSEFRLIRGFTVEHNTQRLKAFCERLAKAPTFAALKRRTRLRRRVAAIKCGKVAS